MIYKLIQKHFLYGRREFELRGDIVKIKINSLLDENKDFEVELAMINPEPIISKSRLEFHSRVKCRPLLSLYLNKPNAKEFNTFVDALKSKAKMEFDTFAGLNSS
ncbi:MAG: hypothetical protein GKR92_11175 [Gammaproteobacteria bacterium]|nr:MAG: hypothetical protein GKR92_11175 [Gammaproteobacteria bacterium]